MAKIKNKERKYLKEKFGERVCFDKVERKLYSHDIAAIPSLVKLFIGEPIPDAIIQPQSEEEIVELLKWAYKKGIPVAPREKATSEILLY